MSESTETHGRWQENVNAYFQAQSSYWKDIYAKGGVQAEIYRARQSTALAWIDHLALAPSSRVLEIGCGAGHMTVALAHRGLRVQAIDSSETMVELARQNAAESGISELISVDVGDVCSMTFRDDCFDLVIAIGVIPWLAEPELAIQEIARVTKPEGHVLLTADNRSRLIHLFDPWTNPTFAPLRRGLKDMLKRIGLYHQSQDRIMETFHDRSFIDEVLTNAGFVKTRGMTLGFGPFTFLRQRVFPTSLDIPLHHKLQRLADRNIPGFRSSGSHYLVLARKQTSQLFAQSPSTEKILSTS